jgi:hypothetical protein
VQVCRHVWSRYPAGVGPPFSMATQGLIICTCKYSNIVYNILSANPLLRVMVTIAQLCDGSVGININGETRSSSSHCITDPKPPQKPAKDVDISFVRMLRPPGCDVINAEASISRRLFWMGHMYWLHMSAHLRTKNSSLTRSRNLPDTITERTE